MVPSDGRAYKKYFFGNPENNFHKQNKSNETIQRHESDTAIQPIPMVDILIVRLFLSTV